MAAAIGAKNPTKMPWQDPAKGISNANFLYILSFLDVGDVKCCSLVSHEWRNLSQCVLFIKFSLLKIYGEGNSLNTIDVGALVKGVKSLHPHVEGNKGVTLLKGLNQTTPYWFLISNGLVKNTRNYSPLKQHTTLRSIGCQLAYYQEVETLLTKTGHVGLERLLGSSLVNCLSETRTQYVAVGQRWQFDFLVIDAAIDKAFGALGVVRGLEVPAKSSLA